MVMKNRRVSGWVTVTGPPFRICLRNSGRMLPREPSTFPKRTTRNCLPPFPSRSTISSARSFEAPYTLCGSTALSVETSTNLSTPALRAASTTFFVPKTLFFTASTGFASMRGTCLCAAVWNTTLARVRGRTKCM